MFIGTCSKETKEEIQHTYIKEVPLIWSDLIDSKWFRGLFRTIGRSFGTLTVSRHFDMFTGSEILFKYKVIYHFIGGSSFKWDKVPKYTFLCLVAPGHSRQAMWNDNRIVCYSHLQMPCSSISPPSSCSISCCPVRPFLPPGGVAPPPGDRRLWSWGSLEPQISLKSLLLPAPKSSHTGTQISSREKQISDDAMIKWTHIVTLEWTQPARNMSFDLVLFPGFLFLPICY